ncbi:MAG: hypothetical protein II845_03380 [Oscillospiraceae bacterium]|nr:hypothetical protein [Oscillospiraceae bacterium]
MMDQLVKLEMLVNQADVPQLLKQDVLKIVTRRTNGQILPYIDARFPGDMQKAQEVAQQVLGAGSIFNLEEVRGALRSAGRNLKSLNTTCKNMSVQVDQIFKAVNSVQNLAYLNAGLSLANIAVNVAGFALISAKLNSLSAEVRSLSGRVNQIANILKNERISEFQKLTMRYNQMSGKLEANEQIDLNELENLIIEMRAFISEMVRNLNEEALQEDIILEIVFTMIPAYTSLLCEFVKMYYFVKQSEAPNYTMFLSLYDELEDSDVKQRMFDYYMLEKKLKNLDVIDVMNAQSLLGINGRVQVEDELDLVRIMETEEKYSEFSRHVDEYVKEQMQAVASAA